MFLRAVLAMSLLSLTLFTGCSTCHVNKEIQAPPPLRFENVGRLADEIAWFYADIEDLIFGIDYFCHVEHRFANTNPYQ